MQIGADVSEGAPGQPAFKKAGNQHNAGEGICQDRGVAAKQIVCATAVVFAGLRIDRELKHQAGGRQSEQSGKDEEHVAPAEQIAEHAAGGLSEQLSKNLPRNVAAEDLLQ